MTGEPEIVTHSDPIGRERTNYVHRLDVDVPPQGRYEHVWTRTEDHETFDLRCIPFFPYNVSYGDFIRVAADGTFQVVQKSGHRTIRVIIHDDT